MAGGLSVEIILQYHIAEMPCVKAYGKPAVSWQESLVFK